VSWRRAKPYPAWNETYSPPAPPNVAASLVGRKAAIQQTVCAGVGSGGAGGQFGLHENVRFDEPSSHESGYARQARSLQMISLRE
jgi:hypothetical protein